MFGGIGFFGRISSEALAANAGFDRSYMSRVERGIANPTVGILERIARELDFEIAEQFRIPGPDQEYPLPIPGGRRRSRLSAAH
jgi:transcriptional regulator with XRE-family HTH domain